jgi:MarR family transcriptional regulator, lower aerobic nicotinate degradation pathway regulator
MLSLTAEIGRQLLVERLAARDLRLGHYATLEVLDAWPGCAQRDVSEFTGHDPSDVVALIDELSGWGLVVREVDPADRRRRALTLTDEGARMLAWCRQQVQEATERFLAPLDTDERQRLLDLVERLGAGHAVSDPTAC